MLQNNMNSLNFLYVFGGEKAQGAEIVIERLMEYNAGTINTHLVISPGDFAANLIERHKPYKITFLNNLKKLNRSSTGKLKFYTKALANYFSVSLQVYKYIRANKINIVHANTIVPASYLLPLVACSGMLLPNVKWLWSDHDMNYGSGIDSRLSKLCIKLYTLTLVVSNAVSKKYGYNPKVKVLYNGLDTAEFVMDPAKRLLFRKLVKLLDDDIVIGIAASINPDKGQLELIEIFKKINVIYPNVKLVLAGNYAAQFPEYRQQVEHAITGNTAITYLGFFDQMAEFYNGCDIIINNSNNLRSESLGTSIYEAMACAVIVLAANTGGTPEIITNGVDGFLFETENMVDFEKKLSYIIDNFTQLNYIKSQARNKVVSKFNIETMATEYNKIISSIY